MKWSGKIGFAQTVETAPSVYTEKITERSYFGEVLEFARRMEDGGQVNGDITLGNQLVFLATRLHRRTYMPCGMRPLWGSVGR